ncbi:uncharacterized protein DUF397 [Stackebrandtia albiflava]|uniref:Uncharacterized protein DUF397 n=1 Tax=Stackebrandtia albiflava TaxID=406432 RepID=A0A562V0X7_9ACTN|nr:DUF397 domain-containing protein [Stackebrandtia albiflava]TWJ11462.1 uncharacterized protein DUF397 [Stackebrandtia albiflava]
MHTPQPKAWRKATRTNASGANCVEVGAIGQAVAVRDSKVPTGPILTTPAEDWRAMLSAIKSGAFDI